MAQLVRDPPRILSVVSLRLRQVILLPKILTIKQFICGTKFQNYSKKHPIHHYFLVNKAWPKRSCLIQMLRTALQRNHYKNEIKEN